jgi:hypothetical protein
VGRGGNLLLRQLLRGENSSEAVEEVNFSGPILKISWATSALTSLRFLPPFTTLTILLKTPNSTKSLVLYTKLLNVVSI